MFLSFFLLTFLSFFPTYFLTMPAFEIPSFYMIPCPKFLLGMNETDQLAQIIVFGSEKCIIEVAWIRDTRQVLFRIPEGLRVPAGDYLQPDGPITQSLAHIVGCAQQFIIAKDMMLCISSEQQERFDDEMRLGFYDCAWSDYACDDLAMQFTMLIDRTCITSSHRIMKVIREMIAEEDRATALAAANKAKRSTVVAAKTATETAAANTADDDEDEYADMPALIPF